MQEIKKYTNPLSNNKNQYILIDSPSEKKILVFLGSIFFSACVLVCIFIGGVLGYLFFVPFLIFFLYYFSLLVFPKKNYTKIGKEGILTKSLWTFFKQLIIPWEKISFFYKDNKRIFIRIKYEKEMKINIFEKYFSFPNREGLQDLLNRNLDRYKK